MYNLLIPKSNFPLSITNAYELCQAKRSGKLLHRWNLDGVWSCPWSPDRIKIKDDMWMEGDDFKRSMYDGSDYGPAAYKRNYKSPVSRFMKLAYQW